MLFDSLPAWAKWSTAWCMRQGIFLGASIIAYSLSLANVLFVSKKGQKYPFRMPPLPISFVRTIITFATEM